MPIPLRRLGALGVLAALGLGAALALAVQARPAVGAVGTWSSLGPAGVRVNVVAVDPNQPSFLVAGTQGQGAYRSTDGGQSWVSANTGLNDPFVNDVLIDPANGNNLLAATGRGGTVGDPTPGIYRSTDRGQSWRRVLQAGTIRALAHTPGAPSVLYAGGSPPVFKSTDGGATWVPSFQPGSDLINLELWGITVSSADPRVLLAAGNTEGGDGQLFRSADAGSTWSRVLGGQAPILDVRFASDPRGGGMAYFGNLAGVFRSADGGRTWERVAEELGEVEVRRVEPSPTSASEVAIATNSGVYRSTNFGSNWRPLDTTLGNRSVRYVSYDRAGQPTLYAGTEDGVWAYTLPRDPGPTPPVSLWFFAEGSTQPPFDTWFLVQNLTAVQASVLFRFSLENGTEISRNVTVAPNSRFSLFANQVLPNVAFSTRVESNQRVFVERSMFVGFDGTTLGGIEAPQRSWLFAEGATVEPFHTWILVQNPGGVPANATLTYLLRDRPPVVQSLGALPPGSRTSVFVNRVLPNQEFSARVESDQPIIVERSMFRFPGNAAATVPGARQPVRDWYFAEGASTLAPPIDTFLLLQNPGQAPATATVTLFAESGRQASTQVDVPPNSRRTVYLNPLLPNSSFGLRFGPTSRSWRRGPAPPVRSRGVSRGARGLQPWPASGTWRRAPPSRPSPR